MRGGELVFNMGPEPNKAWGTGFTAFPESYIREYPITPVPAFYQGDHTFMDSTVVAMASALPGVNINFTTNGSDPKASSDTYKRPMLLRKTTTIKAFSIGQESSASPIIEAKFLRIPKNRKIKLNTTYAGQYSAGGDLALIDFKRGGGNFRTGSWQGYEGNDIDAIVDLGVAEPVVRVSLGCMQDQGSWIFMPEEVVISVSQDGVNFSEVVKLKNETDERAAEPVVHEFTANLKGQKVRYIKVYARNRGKCPEWHLGAGGKAWLFADEIVIE
jgi:hypothetical protein